MQVISSSKVVRRDSSVGSAVRGFLGPNADQSDQDPKSRQARESRGQNLKTNSRNNSRLSNGRGELHGY